MQRRLNLLAHGFPARRTEGVSEVDAVILRELARRKRNSTFVEHPLDLFKHVRTMSCRLDIRLILAVEYNFSDLPDLDRKWILGGLYLINFVIAIPCNANQFTPQLVARIM